MLQIIKHKIWTILIAGLLLCSGMSAQDVSVKATLDSVVMLIGHQSKLTLEITQPADADIAFPMVLDTLVDKVEVLSRTDIDTIFVNDERLHLTQEFMVTSFDSGFYYIPPFNFEIQPNSGGGTLETDPIVLKMFTYQIDTIGGIFDVKPIKRIPYEFREFVPFIWGFVVLQLILIAIALLWIYFKKEPIFAPAPKPQEPPYITAFRELERIRSEKLWQKDKEKEYYTDLTDTLRSYLEGRFHVLAMEQTTDEIMEEIKGLISKEHYKKLEDTLRLADLVKFAKMKPMMDESERCIKDVYAFVDNTKLVPEDDEDEADDEEAETEDDKPEETVE